jgi:hypothetical protein
LIDEYQDTNHAQYKVTSLLAGKYKNICVVGDDAQSIYSFRGADISNILNFKSDYESAVQIPWNRITDPPNLSFSVPIPSSKKMKNSSIKHSGQTMQRVIPSRFSKILTSVMKPTVLQLYQRFETSARLSKQRFCHFIPNQLSEQDF